MSRVAPGRRLTVLLLAILALGAGAPGASADAGRGSPAVERESAQADPSAASGRWRPRAADRWQVQFTGSIDLAVQADVFDLDLFDTPRARVDAIHRGGRRAVCYINAGAWEDWRPDASRFPRAVLGRPLVGWAGERWLDIRRTDLLAPILRARLDQCRAKGFDGVEFDNVDGYANETGFPLTASQQLRFDRWLATEAHLRGLAAGLKNDLEQVRDLVASFDFAINESCWTWRECHLLRPFRTAGKAVLVIEYTATRAEFCPTVRSLGYVGMRKRLSLDAWRAPCA